MSDKIKPSEVSQVLLEQLQGINNSQQFDEVGTVLEVSDGVALSTDSATPRPTSFSSSRMALWLS